MEEEQIPRHKSKAWPYLSVELIYHNGGKDRTYRHVCAQGVGHGRWCCFGKFFKYSFWGFLREKGSKITMKSEDNGGSVGGSRERGAMK